MDTRPNMVCGPKIDHMPTALRMEPFDPIPRCILRPLTDAAAIVRDTRPFHTAQSWSHFGYCQATSCAECPIQKAFNRRKDVNTQYAVIRFDGEKWWLMNRRDGGWAENGYCYPTLRDTLATWAVHLCERKSDEHGAYWTLTSPAD